MAVNKRKRTHKISKGERRSSLPIPQTAVQLALAGKGMVAAIAHVPCKVAWRGVGSLSGQPFNKEQAELNRKLYPELFRDGGRR